MKKFLVFFLVLIGVVAVAVVTCPDHQSHKDAILADLKACANEGSYNQGFSAMLDSIDSSVAGFVIDNRLSVTNRFVCSIGKLKSFDGENITLVSVGVFGHVFTIGKEGIKSAM